MRKGKIITPVVTAFDASGNIDVEGNKRVYDHLISGGVDGIAVMGSTGEFFAMNMAQKRLLTETAVKHIAGRTKVYIGTNCPTVEETIALSNEALSLGADAVMIIHSYYFALSEASIEAFFDEAASAINGNIILYNFPARTGSDLKPEIVLRLLKKHKNIVGYKDTVAEMGHTRRLIEMTRKDYPDFEVFSGFDEFFVHNIMSGGAGCIGGIANIFPEIFVKWIKALEKGDMDTIESIQKTINHLMGIYEISGTFIPIIKKAMILQGIQIEDICTKPLLPATEEETEKLKAILKAYDAMRV
ncbi:MAG: 2-dehydro-3-deoxy-D-pentonate aldolase [Clostridiales bacterium]|jgi:4-hydroxy-tetrahydrodipicolinate synthase|nr:2-dehydro-3-deoxy-D-pentonate aldolase [Clostridiales bacterium]